ncbi:hypothetical protein TPA0907_57060 [Micromonospora humidisoli]|uniref:hypothetical protein n=1 Tax=Micromonospora sp. AKA109 TaxID=2733865 RepID=UPI0022C2AFA4|nr:hypothetical protein [Micromonospora sp. AKA109]GHJ11339.1 hypothetical protein TPA0907_57060 [Micromonospora sp. AKA109]
MNALDIGHPVFQLELGMDTAAVVRLLGEKYLSMGACWLYSDTPAGCDIQLVFRFGALASVEVKTRAAQSATTVLMVMDRDRIAAAPPYQVFVDREIQRRARRTVGKIVVLHPDDELSPEDLRVVVSFVEVKLGVNASGVLPRVMSYDVVPESITLSFGMAVLAKLVSEGEIACHPANPAWVGEFSIRGNPRVVLVCYEQDL